jgi:predicted alpha/beta-fold hydrolase
LACSATESAVSSTAPEAEGSLAGRPERGRWRVGQRLRAHFWTLAPRLRHSLRPVPEPPAAAWGGTVEDPDLGPIRLSGRLHLPAAADTAAVAGAATTAGELVVLVHGLGGDSESHYMLRGARAAAAAGIACLRLNLRGADLSGEDFYHAGLTADVHAALASPELRPFRRLYLLGYSLGGHLVLRCATEAGDPRLAAAAAVCSPLDLARSQSTIDAPAAWPYRRYLIRRLVRLYAAVAARRPVPLPVAAVARLRQIRDFDDRVVAPRHGFAGADDYYARASVAPRLGLLRLPALLVNAEHDPMVQAGGVRPVLEHPVPRLEVRWLPDGGHLGFPASVALALDTAAGPPGEPREPGGDDGEGRGSAGTVDDQVIGWLRRR